MLKSQDIVTLAKLLANQVNKQDWTQPSLAIELCISASEVNAALKRLVKAGLITDYFGENKPQPIVKACLKFFEHGIRHVFPAEIGSLTTGVPTSFNAPILKDQVVSDQNLIYVWPDIHGDSRGLEFKPLYRTVPKSVLKYPDQQFYDILALLDAIRGGKTRERAIAVKLLTKLLH